ncbi:MAG: hypothetical protein ACYTFY_12085 [Planctomycetota bacterium]|jgi:hypothetical protein
MTFLKNYKSGRKSSEKQHYSFGMVLVYLSVFYSALDIVFCAAMEKYMAIEPGDIAGGIVLGAIYSCPFKVENEECSFRKFWEMNYLDYHKILDKLTEEEINDIYREHKKCQFNMKNR